MPGNTQVFFIGRPDLEKPHESMERCERFHANNPGMKLVCIVSSEKDRADLAAKAGADLEVILWDDEGALLNWLMDRLGKIVGTRIVWPQWWVCPSQHIEAFDYEKPAADEAVKKCGTCNEARVLVQPEKERVGEFAELFAQVCGLANFDTTSGEYLHAAVSPIANVLENHRELGRRDVAGKSVDSLKDTGKGMGAILCAAGPSLDDAIPELVRLSHSGKWVVSCVGRSYKKLRAAGVRVHYAVSVEMFDWDSAIFDDVGDVGDTVLIYATVCAPATLRKWPGRIACLFDMETGMALKHPHTILGGNSVAHHQMNFAAQVLGCEPIVLVGNDLAYTKPEGTHAKGTDAAAWPEEIRKDDAEGHKQEMWVPCTGAGNLFYPECHRAPVAGMGGSLMPMGMIEVRSSPSYFHFATLFSMLIKRHGKKVLNACANGQVIRGTEYVDLATL